MKSSACQTAHDTQAGLAAAVGPFMASRGGATNKAGCEASGYEQNVCAPVPGLPQIGKPSHEPMGYTV